MSSRPFASLAALVVLALVPSSNAQVEPESSSAAFRKAARAVLPSVVGIRGLGGVAVMRPVPGFLAPGATFAGRDGVPDSGGSGVVIDASRGYVLTNDHVVPDSPRLVVTLADGRRRDAKEVRRDPRSDLALIVIDPEGLSQAEWGDSDAIDLADWVIAIGQPFGLAGTVTVGNVSGERRGFGPSGYDDLIQTSVAINPGSSGGPLVDLKGKVVGINVAIKTVSGGYEGVGFAIPASRARRVASDLAEYGRVRRGFLGLATEKIEPERVARTGESGELVVTSIEPGSSAEASGLRVGDVILKVGDRRVTTPASVRLAVEFAPIGEELTLTIVRDSQTLTSATKPTALPDEARGGIAPAIIGR